MKFLALLSLLLLSSCISSKFTPVNEFDFKQLPPEKIKVHVGRILMEGPYSEKIARRSAYSLNFDEYNRWCEKPEDLFKRHWQIILKDNASAQFSGISRRFDFDMTTHEAVIIFDLKTKNKTQQIIVKEGFSGNSATDCVIAMNEAFKKLTLEITQNL